MMNTAGYHVPPWQVPWDRLALSEDEVHVWRAALDQSPSRTQEFLELLGPEERERAERFHFKRDRDRFIVARGVLRAVLAQYLDEPAARLRFAYTSYGKPYLVEPGRGNLRFNLSHSDGIAVVAVALGRELGVDVERMRGDVAEEKIAERFFSESEIVSLRALPAEQQAEGFFNCWTRKEAYIKARGEGLSLPLDKFDVSLSPGEPAALLSTSIDPEDMGRWRLMSLSPGAGYAGALVAEGQDLRVKCWQWPG